MNGRMAKKARRAAAKMADESHVDCMVRFGRKNNSLRHHPMCRTTVYRKLKAAYYGMHRAGLIG